MDRVVSQLLAEIDDAQGSTRAEQQQGDIFIIGACGELRLRAVARPRRRDRDLTAAAASCAVQARPTAPTCSTRR